MKVTDHAEKRVRKRLGIPKRTVDKLSSLALADGSPQSAFCGSFRKYLDWLGRTHLTSPLVYHGYIWIFSGSTLITTYPVPAKFRNHAKNAN